MNKGRYEKKILCKPTSISLSQPDFVFKNAKTISKDRRWKLSWIYAAAMRCFLSLSENDQAEWYKIAYDPDREKMPDNLTVGMDVSPMNGRELKTLLAKMGMMQSDLAQRLGDYPATVSKYANDVMPIPPDIAARIRQMAKHSNMTCKEWTGADVLQLRQRLDMTQSALAKKLDVAHETVCRWEKDPKKIVGRRHFTALQSLSEVKKPKTATPMSPEERYILDSFRDLTDKQKGELVVHLMRYRRDRMTMEEAAELAIHDEAADAQGHSNGRVSAG